MVGWCSYYIHNSFFKRSAIVIVVISDLLLRGTIFKYTYTETIDKVKTENVIAQAVGKTTNGQLQSNTAGSEQMLILSLADNKALTSLEQETITFALNETFPNAHLALAESLTVEPFLGAHFFKNGMLAIGLAFLLVLVYVGFRFKNIGGVSADAWLNNHG